MKNYFVVLMLFPLCVFAQKKSGVIFSEHPALMIVEATYKTFCSGDLESYASHFDPDVRIWSIGDTEPHGLKKDLESSKWWTDNFTLKISRDQNVTPDIIQYKGDKKGVWVYDWTRLTAINKTSGDTVKTWFHDEFYVSNDNKITMWLSYYNQNELGAQIQNSFGAHRNGRVYDEHPIINTLNEMVAHFEAGEITELATYFTEDAEFYRLGVDGKLNLEERTATWHASVAKNSVRNLEQSGYPDAIYYSRGEGQWVVQSWWWVNNTNAETGEVTREYLHMSHDFNDDGKVTREVIYMAN